MARRQRLPGRQRKALALDGLQDALRRDQGGHELECELRGRHRAVVRRHLQVDEERGDAVGQQAEVGAHQRKDAGRRAARLRRQQRERAREAGGDVAALLQQSAGVALDAALQLDLAPVLEGEARRGVAAEDERPEARPAPDEERAEARERERDRVVVAVVGVAVEEERGEDGVLVRAAAVRKVLEEVERRQG